MNLLYKSFLLIKFKTDTKYFWKEEKCDKDVCNLKVNVYVTQNACSNQNLPAVPEFSFLDWLQIK